MTSDTTHSKMYLTIGFLVSGRVPSGTFYRTGGENMLKGLGTALVGSIIVLTTLGVALGASLGETDIFNPTTSSAQAESMNAQVQIDRAEAQLEIEQHQAELAAQQAANALALEHQAAMYEQAEEHGKAELRHYETTLANERLALERQHELELQYQKQALERKGAMMEAQQPMLLGIGSGAILAITIAVAYYFYACAQAKLAQVPRAEDGRRPAAKPHSKQPAPRQPITPAGRQVMASFQNQPGGNGRGPRVHSRSRG